MLMFFHNLQAAQITTFCFYSSNKKNVPVNVIEKTSKTPFKNWPIIRKKKRERNKEFLSVSSANHYSHPKKSGNWFNRSVTCLSSSWFHFRLQRERCCNVQLLWNQIWKKIFLFSTCDKFPLDYFGFLASSTDFLPSL